MSDELNPCPFCGGKADVGEFAAGHGVGGPTDGFYVTCVEEFCDGHMGSGYYAFAERERAVAAWNRRPTEERLAAEVARLERELATVAERQRALCREAIVSFRSREVDPPDAIWLWLEGAIEAIEQTPLVTDSPTDEAPKEQ